MNLFRPTKFSLWGSTDYALPRVFYGGGKNQQSTSQVSIPPEILANYQNVNSIANQVAQTPFQQYSTDPNAFVAPLTATQQAGILGTNQYSNEAQPFYQAASNASQNSALAGMNMTATAASPITSGQIENYENPYESQVITPTEQLMQQQFNQAQSGQLGNAIQNGAFGGDRAAVAAANLQQQQALAYGQTLGGLLNQNYSQALGEANTEQQAGLQGANQYAQIGANNAVNQANFGSGAQTAGLSGAQAQLAAGQAQQQTEQAGETALYNQFLQQQSYPFQTTQFLGNIAEGTGALSGSTTTANQPAPFFSDERLKEDMEPVGKTFDGLNIYKFRYKGDKQTHVGLSAQDVERKHPDAVGLAGGYKTVDYDAATNEAAHKGRAHQGGLVLPFRRQDGSIVPERKHYDVGGYAGLSPNAAWAAGFNLDPSYLQAQQAAYGNAPWGNAGPVSGASPYGGKSHVPPSTGSPHAALAVAHPPQQQSQNQLQQLASGVNQLEGLGKTGKSLFNDVKQNVPGLAPPVAAPVAPAAPQAQLPPDHVPVTSGTGSPIAPSNNASAGLMASVDPSDLNAADDLGLAFSKRGGRIQRDAGGATYQDATTDDESAGGDVPYDSGTGSSGLDIPDDKPHNSLATSQPPASSANSGSSISSLLGPIIGGLGLFGLAKGGRVGLAAGGDSGDMPSPKVGLNPDAPSPDAQPVQMVQDMGAPPHQTQPGEVLPQDGLGGIGDTLNKNQGLIVPLLHGLGTMASSNSRYLGSAILQGLGGAADSYEQTQNEMQGRAGNQPIITQRQNEAGQSDLDLYQSMIAQRPELRGMTFAQFEAAKANGKLNSIPGGAGLAPSGGAQPYNYTIQEKNSGVNAQGVPLSQDPAYLAGFAAHNAGIQSRIVAGQVHQANEQAGAINGQQYTYNNNGSQVTLPGMNSRVMAQNEPAVQTKQGSDFRDAKTNFLNSYQPTQSLLNEMSGIYQNLRTGPTSELRARISNLANDLDPEGKIPLLHSLSANSTGEDYQTAMKDIAQITAQRLSGMSAAAPKSETELLSQFAANPDKSPGTVRDVIIRGQALLQQQHDYYKGYDPFRSNQAVPDYTDNFYENHPFESYRQKLEKSTPAFAGEQANQRNQPNATAAPSAPISLNAQDPDAHYNSLPSGARFVGPDGKVRVKP